MARPSSGLLLCGLTYQAKGWWSIKHGYKQLVHRIGLAANVDPLPAVVGLL